MSYLGLFELTPRRTAKVKGAEFTGNKIAGLEVRARESYLGLLETNLRANYDQVKKTDAAASNGGGGGGKWLVPYDILQVDG